MSLVKTALIIELTELEERFEATPSRLLTSHTQGYGMFMLARANYFITVEDYDDAREYLEKARSALSSLAEAIRKNRG